MVAPDQREEEAYYCNFSLEYDLAQRIEEQLCLPTIDVSRPMRSVVGAVRHRAAGRELIHVQERMFGHIRGEVREQSLIRGAIWMHSYLCWPLASVRTRSGPPSPGTS